MALENVNGVSIGTATSAETGFGQYQETSKFFCANGKAITISARTDDQAGCIVTWENEGADRRLLHLRRFF